MVTVLIRRWVKRVVPNSLLMAYRNYRENKPIRIPEEPSALGFRFAGNVTMADGTFEPEETAVVRRELASTDVFINVGANVGYYTCLALSMGKQTIAFEPMPGNLRYLCGNVVANGWQAGAEIFPVALAEHPGVMPIYGSGTGASLVEGWAGTDRGFQTLIPVSTLNICVGQRFAGRRVFVLMDVEGGEFRVLEGAVNLLRNEPRPVWMVEVCYDMHQPKGRLVNPDFAAVFNVFFDLGYKAVTADNRHRPVTRQELDALLQGGCNTLGTHNFLFCDPSRTPATSVLNRSNL